MTPSVTQHKKQLFCKQNLASVAKLNNFLFSDLGYQNVSRADVALYNSYDEQRSIYHSDIILRPLIKLQVMFRSSCFTFYAFASFEGKE